MRLLAVLPFMKMSDGSYAVSSDASEGELRNVLAETDENFEQRMSLREKALERQRREDDIAMKEHLQDTFNDVFCSGPLASGSPRRRWWHFL